MTNPAKTMSDARDAIRTGPATKAVEKFAHSSTRIKAVDEALATVYPDTLENEPYNLDSQLEALETLMRVEALIQAADDYLFECARRAYKEGKLSVAKIALVTGKSRSTINLWVNRNRRGHA